LKKMTAFIRQEALEKAHEIHLKADEEFAIEKSKLVRQETAAIDSQYEKKFKQASMSQQITKSTSANKTRLRVLSARQSLLDELFEEARSKVGKAAEGKDYDQILTGLILEGMYLLQEPKVQIRARGKDKDRVESAIKRAAKEYKKNMGKEVEAAIDDKNPLPDSSYVAQCLGHVVAAC
jgi:V-type H+-transporting ATPase subunit E